MVQRRLCSKASAVEGHFSGARQRDAGHWLMIVTPEERSCSTHGREKTMIDDPIVEDVYRARQEILDQCGGDLWKWLERLKAAEGQHPNQVVTLEDVRKRCERAKRRCPTEAKGERECSRASEDLTNE